MQTLVYENYNKFISATDTIKKVKIAGSVSCQIEQTPQVHDVHIFMINSLCKQFTMMTLQYDVFDPLQIYYLSSRQQGQILLYNSISCFGSRLSSKHIVNTDKRSALN